MVKDDQNMVLLKLPHNLEARSEQLADPHSERI